MRISPRTKNFLADCAAVIAVGAVMVVMVLSFFNFGQQ